MSPTVPRSWVGETVACIGTGPSLTAADVNRVRGNARVIAVNDAVRLAPWADVLYACDGKWWNEYQGMPTFKGVKYSLTVNSRRFPDVIKLRTGAVEGLSLDPTTLRTGRNSGYQAINLAVLYGAVRILLLGYDMSRHSGKSHFFGEHPHQWTPSDYKTWVQNFRAIVAPLQKAGVTVINCTRVTALTCFPQMPLDQALSAPMAVAS